MSAPADRAQAVRLLAEELRAEIAKLEETVEECRAAATRFAAGAPARLELLGVGALLHAFYNGVERALSRVAPDFNGGLPAGEAWHRRLLEQMTMELPGVRPAALSRETALLLDEFRGFRHRFRNLYFFDLRWDRCSDLLRALPAAWSATRADLERFVAFLDRLGAEPEAPA